MKRKLLIITCLLIAETGFLFSQRETDIGLSGGISYYMGDINPSQIFYSPQPNLGLVYRYNLNPHYILKFEANYISLTGNDMDFDNQFQKSRAGSFSNKLADLSAQFELNFLPLKFDVRRIGFTPFVSTGAAYAISLGSTGGFAIPFALGTKFTAGKNWTLGIAWNFRKTFTDKLDEIQNGVFDSQDLIGSYRTSTNNNDWYSFANIFITYKIFDYRAECPAYMNSY